MKHKLFSKIQTRRFRRKKHFLTENCPFPSGFFSLVNKRTALLSAHHLDKCSPVEGRDRFTDERLWELRRACTHRSAGKPVFFDPQKGVVLPDEI